MAFGVIVGYLIGMNLSPVKADYDYQIYNALTDINDTLGSIDSKLRKNNRSSVLWKISDEIDDVERAINFK